MAVYILVSSLSFDESFCMFQIIFILHPQGITIFGAAKGQMGDFQSQ